MTPKVKKFIEENIELIDANQSLYCKMNRELDRPQIEELENVFKEAGIEGVENKILFNLCRNRRIHQIKGYNVGFGDCFLCKNEENSCAKMLVDCGGHSENVNSVLANIKDELLFSHRKYLMISHLHNDHYSGIKKLLDKYPTIKFNEVYLPNYIMNGSLELYAAMIFLRSNDQLAKLAREVLLIPGILANHLTRNAKICFLSEGGRIFNCLCALEILLPRKNKHRILVDDISPIKEFCDKYKRILGYEENESGTVVTVLDLREHNVREELQKLFDEFDKLFTFDIDKSQCHVEDLKEQFQNHHNSLSIAFQQLFVNDEENVLFLGDAETADIEYIAKYKLNQKYCFVKVQHHGTKTHFSPNLPPAKHYAISNGGKDKKRHISGEYDRNICPNSNFICTNNCNCELYNSSPNCSHAQNGSVCGIKQKNYYEISIP